MNGVCRVNEFTACGTNGGSCVSCNVVRTNQCVSGVCRCGSLSACGLNRYCEGIPPDGVCIYEPVCDPICR